MDLSKRIVGGVEFEAVRFERPVPHWRLRVVQTGVIIEAGVFKGETRPKMWESVEDTARRRGDSFVRACLDAK